MILITGATGNLGRETINFLLKKIPSSEISALIRNPDKAEDLKHKGIKLHKGDYNDYDSLIKAFKGIDKLLLISSNDFVNRVNQHINVINAAKENGVKHIYYTSGARTIDNKEIPGVKDHLETEQYLENSGINYTILKNNLYIENLPMYLGEKVLETGIYFPGTGKVAFASRTDMAEATANLLVSNEVSEKTYNFSNTEAVDFNDIASILTKITGKKIDYIEVEPNIYREQLTKIGIPTPVINLRIGFGSLFKGGFLNTPNSALEEILGHKTINVEEFLKKFYLK